MVEPLLIDLKALLVEREDCDAGTVQKIREALAQGRTQYRTLRDVADVLKKKTETAAAPVAKKWHLKLGIASFFLGHLGDAVEHLKQAEGALANFYLGRALVERPDYDEALKAFEKAEKAGYTASPGAAPAGRHPPPQGRHRPGPGHPRPSWRTRPATTPNTISSSPAATWPRANAALAVRAPGKVGRARPRPHRRPFPARPRQRPGRQRRRGHQLLRALPQSSAGPRRRADEPRHPLRGPRQVRQGGRLLSQDPQRRSDATSRPGCSCKDAQASQTMYYNPGRRHGRAAGSARCWRSRSPISSCRCAAAIASRR